MHHMRKTGWRRRVAALAGAMSALSVMAAEPASAPTGMVEQPCTPLPPKPASTLAFERAFLEPGKPDLPRMLALTQDPAHIAWQEARKARDAQDWAGLCRYRDDNAALVAAGRKPAIVFYGDSITENWVAGDPPLFGPGIIGRGISGQTSAQMLVRFHADVVSLQPQAVHIMAGTNDVAGNNGPTTEQAWRDNIMAMVEIARAHGIRVVLGSIPPAARFIWRPELRPAAQIVRLNAWLRDYARKQGLHYLDYHAAMAGADGGMKPEYSIDGVHPNREGYAAMRALAASAR